MNIGRCFDYQIRCPSPRLRLSDSLAVLDNSTIRIQTMPSTFLLISTPETSAALVFLLSILDDTSSLRQLSRNTMKEMWFVSLILYGISIATAAAQSNGTSPAFPQDDDNKPPTTLWEYMRQFLYGMIKDFLDFISLRTGLEVNTTSILERWMSCTCEVSEGAVTSIK